VCPRCTVEGLAVSVPAAATAEAATSAADAAITPTSAHLCISTQECIAFPRCQANRHSEPRQKPGRTAANQSGFARGASFGNGDPWIALHIMERRESRIPCGSSPATKPGFPPDETPGGSHMKRILIPLVALGIVLAVVAASASAKSQKSSATAQACVLLPDKTSSVRYELFDRPLLGAAFKRLGISNNILNALGSATTQRSQADQCITNGAKVILVDALDSGTGASIEKAAAAKGVKTIDYDRLVLGGKASYYVSYDNVQVGVTMAKGL